MNLSTVLDVLVLCEKQCTCMSKQHNNVHKKEKVKALYLTPVVPSVTILVVSMEADSAPFTPLLPLPVSRFTGT